MCPSAAITLEIEEAEDRTLIASVITPADRPQLIAEVELVAGVLWARNVHAQGLAPGVLGRAGLNAIARKVLEEADAQAVVVEGAARTTGANQRRRPRAFRFPR